MLRRGHHESRRFRPFYHGCTLRWIYAAANALDLPRSNVSRRINKLEEELNAKLFFRTTRQLSLTRYGQSYFDEVVKALEALERAKHITTQIAEAPKGCVKGGITAGNR